MSKSLIASINSACDSVEDAGAGAVLLVQLKPATAGGEPAEAIDVHLVNHWERALRRLERLRAATIATVEGRCGGLGTAVLLTTDYRIAAGDVHLSLMSGQDILPSMTLHRIAGQIGAAAGRQLVLFGMDMAADRAMELGMVDTIADDVEAATATFVKSLATLYTEDLSVRRRLLNEAPALNYDDALGAHLAACDRVLRRAHASAAAQAQAEASN
nr:enoyl-CoA-hydratase DpgB [Pseudoduganella ginsengisoli]